MDLTIPYTFYPIALPHWIAWALFVTVVASMVITFFVHDQ